MKRFGLILLVFLFLCGMVCRIEAKTCFSHGERVGKRVALSFDDGPHPSFTPKILALLKKYNVKATFFMIGCNIALYPGVAKAVEVAGHEIGNHTYTHPHMREISLTVLKEEIQKTENVLLQNGMKRPHLFRPPEGFRSEEQVRALEELGYHTVIWSLDTHDWQGRPTEEIVSVVLEGIQGGDVLLFHDYTSRHNTTITALEQLIPRLLEDGYEFVVVSDLMC